MSTVTPPASGSEGPVLRSLFDVRFARFATPSLIRIVYTVTLVILTLAAGLILLAALFGGFLGGGEGAVFALAAVVFIPVVWLLSIIYIRVVLETVMVLFRIADNTRPAPPGPTRPRDVPGGPQAPPSGPPLG